MGKVYAFEASKTKWIPFGAGSRSCAGKHYAMAAMVPMFEKLLCNPKFQPRLGHRYSGRNNDGEESLGESIYQIQTFLEVMSTLVWKNRCFTF